MEITPPASLMMPTTAVRDPATGNRDEDLRAAADQFESLFVTMMLKSARQAGEVFKDDLTGGKGVDMANSMFDMKVAEVVSNRTRLGIGQAIYRQFSGSSR